MKFKQIWRPVQNQQCWNSYFNIYFGSSYRWRIKTIDIDFLDVCMLHCLLLCQQRTEILMKYSLVSFSLLFRIFIVFVLTSLLHPHITHYWWMKQRAQEVQKKLEENRIRMQLKTRTHLISNYFGIVFQSHQKTKNTFIPNKHVSVCTENSKFTINICWYNQLNCKFGTLATNVISACSIDDKFVYVEALSNKRIFFIVHQHIGFQLNFLQNANAISIWNCHLETIFLLSNWYCIENK